MTPIEKKRKELELARVTTAKMDLEFKILEREEEIKRLMDNITIQDQRISELKEELSE